MENNTPYKSIYYPPGGILLWIIIFLELITFAAAIIVMIVYSKEDPHIFHRSRLQLNPFWGTLNTCILLSSGYFMAEAVKKEKQQDCKNASSNVTITIFLGSLFVLIKILEYYQKWTEGIGFSSNMFFSFYWSLTIFHLTHVLCGLAILLYFSRTFKRNRSYDSGDFASGATFWHLCDLIWLLIFPTLYLLF